MAYSKYSSSQNDYTDKGECRRKQLLSYNMDNNMLGRAALRKATYLHFYKGKKMLIGTIASQPSLDRYQSLLSMTNASRILGFVSPY